MAERIDQRFPERPLVEFGHHRGKQTHGQFSSWIPRSERLRYLLYGLEQRAAICIVHLDVGADQNLESRLACRDKTLQ